MRKAISILIIILLFSISALADETTKIVKTREMIESQYGSFGYLGIGDRVYKVTYTDGTTELQYERGTKVFGAFIYSVPPSVTLNAGQTLTFPYNIRGTSCNFNIGRTHVISIRYTDNTVIKTDSFPNINCNADNWKTFTLSPSQFSRFNQAGQSGLIKMVETIPNPGSFEGVVRGDTVLFTVIIASPTPSPTPTKTSTPTPITTTQTPSPTLGIITSTPSPMPTTQTPIPTTPTPIPTFYVLQPPLGYTIEGCWNAAVEKPGYIKPCDMKTWDGNITIVPEATPAPIVTHTPTPTPTPISLTESQVSQPVIQSPPPIQPPVVITPKQPCPAGYNEEANGCVRYLYNKETVPVTPGFEVVYPIIGLIFITWLINRKKY